MQKKYEIVGVEQITFNDGKPALESKGSNKGTACSHGWGVTDYVVPAEGVSVQDAVKSWCEDKLAADYDGKPPSLKRGDSIEFRLVKCKGGYDIRPISFMHGAKTDGDFHWLPAFSAAAVTKALLKPSFCDSKECNRLTQKLALSLMRGVYADMEVQLDSPIHSLVQHAFEAAIESAYMLGFKHGKKGKMPKNIKAWLGTDWY